MWFNFLAPSVNISGVHHCLLPQYRLQKLANLVVIALSSIIVSSVVSNLRPLSLLGTDQLMLTAGPNIAPPPAAAMVPPGMAPGMVPPGGQMMYGAGYPPAQPGYPQQY